MGKLTARERIEAIFGQRLFPVSTTCSLSISLKILIWIRKFFMVTVVIIGTGTIYGEPVCIYAQDFTVAGGSLG